MEKQTIVIGGGIAGLTAGALLARGGQPVLVLEKSSRLGGRAATRVEDGYHLNHGPHAFYPGGAATRLLRELDIRYTGGSPKQVLALDDGQLHTFPTGASSLVGTKLLDPRDKLEFVRVFATLPMAKAAAVADLDVATWLARTVRRPRVRHLLASLGRTAVYCDALDVVSAEVLLARLQLSVKQPVRYVDGGWQTLVDGLRAAAERAGAEVRTGARAERVEAAGGRVVGLHLANGTTLPAEAVVIGTTPVEATSLLGDLAPELAQQVAGAPEATVACLDVALDHLPRPGTLVVQDLQGPRFLTIQSVAAKVAPPGGAVVHAVKQLDPRRPTNPRDDERELEAFLDELQPDWRDHVVARVFLPRMTASGIVPTAAAGGFAGRPEGRVPGLDGAYLAGDWVGAEGFQIDASMASAEAAAKLVLGADATALRAA